MLVSMNGLRATMLLALLSGALAAAGDAPGPIAEPDPHAQHRQAASAALQIDRRTYVVPDIALQNEQGRPVKLRELMSPERPVVINFIFTSCTTICPVMTATLLQVQRHLADDPARPLFVSISIDPEFDNATTLKSYAERYGAQWTFLTGQRADVLAVLRAFDAYRGNKVNHFALTLLHAPNDTEWTRIEGLASSQELARLWQDIAS